MRPTSQLRVALVTRSFSWEKAGGGEVLVRLLAHQLVSLGHHVTVLTGDARGVPAGDARFDVRVLEKLSALRVRRELTEVRPDVVDAHNMECAPATVAAARALRLPVVVTANSAWPTCLFADMYRPGYGICATCSVEGVADCFRKRPAAMIGRRVPAVLGYAETRRRLAVLKAATRVIAHSEAAKFLYTRNGVPAARVRVVPNFDEPTFHAAHLERAGRILYVGGITHPKGVDVLLDAFVRLAPRVPHARLQLAGDGYARPDIEREAEARGVRDRVDLLGYVPHAQIRELYRRASCIVFPVRTEEAFGRVILEGWGTGTPVVVSDVSAPGEIVRDGETGLVVPPESPIALADALQRVLTDDALAERLAENGRKELARFEPASVVSRWADVYREAIASTSS